MSLAHDLAGTSGDQVIGLGYNPASQIVSRTGSNDAFAWTGSVAVNRPYAVNGLNQYSSAGASTFAYDFNGNLVTATQPPYTSSYVYDVENRLVSASGAQTAFLVYDPLGRLFQVSGWASGATQFLYDDDALVAEYNSAGTMVHRYIHGALKGVDDPLIWYHNQASGWRRPLVADQQGSIVAIADMHGNPIAINAYDEYGIPKFGNVGRFQYTGQAWIPELGMYHYKSRLYSPTLGRFLQTDPIGYKDQINLYAYVGNGPINSVDPTGTSCAPTKSGYVCKIDRVELPKGQKDLTQDQAAKLKAFERRYSATVNTLYKNNRTVTVGPTSGRKGTSFKVNSRDTAEVLEKKTFIYQVGKAPGNALMDSGKNYGGSWTNVYKPEIGRGANQMNDIAHEGIHRSPSEQFGNPLGPVLGNSPYQLGHQESYNKAATDMLSPE